MPARKLDIIESDICHCGADIPTEWKLYRQVKEHYTKNRTEKVIVIMRHYDQYSILGDDADLVAPVLTDVLTHKHAGRMYCYDRENYSYHVFSFGRHNLDKVLPVIIRNDWHVAISDFDAAFKEWGGHPRADRLIAEAEAKRKQQQPKPPVQLSLFDVEGFL